MQHAKRVMAPRDLASDLQALTPLFTVFISRVFFGHVFHSKIYLSLVPIVVG